MQNTIIQDNFWNNYLNLIRDVVIPYQWDILNDNIEGAEKSHAISNFKIAAGLENGEFYGMVFQDSDVYKWLEAASYVIERFGDKSLEEKCDYVIDLLEKAQQPDGYLNTYFTLKEPGNRWTNLEECHELYCAGHFIEAAVAYFKATGKRKVLDIACKLADHIDSVFGVEEGKIRGYDGHQEIELALFKLYKVTNNRKYLNLAKYFLEERGKEPYFFYLERQKRGGKEHWRGFSKVKREYTQSHLPIREQKEAVGHAVRAVYMYSAIADIAYETNDQELMDVCKRLWNDMVNRKMYISGGIGSTSHGEAFTFSYDLPNDTIYAETCASIGLIFFAQRMLNIEQKSEYADVIERALYNIVIESMSLDGKRYFYVNPLEVYPEECEKNPTKHHVKYERQKWFACACCPPNVARLLSSLDSYIYLKKNDSIFVNQYIGSIAKFDISENIVTLTQKTGIPYDDSVSIQINTENKTRFSLALRIPSWCLYDYSVELNGKKLSSDDISTNNGYIHLDRIWEDGDQIKIVFSMPVLRVYAHSNVRFNQGKVAIQRGPLVYCLEEVDNQDRLYQIYLPKDAKLNAVFDNHLFGGIYTIQAEAMRIKKINESKLYSYCAEDEKKEQLIKFIPYYLWANREKGEMIVWVNEII